MCDQGFGRGLWIWKESIDASLSRKVLRRKEERLMKLEGRKRASSFPPFLPSQLTPSQNPFRDRNSLSTLLSLSRVTSTLSLASLKSRTPTPSPSSSELNLPPFPPLLHHELPPSNPPLLYISVSSHLHRRISEIGAQASTLSQPGSQQGDPRVPWTDFPQGELLLLFRFPSETRLSPSSSRGFRHGTRQPSLLGTWRPPAGPTRLEMMRRRKGREGGEEERRPDEVEI